MATGSPEFRGREADAMAGLSQPRRDSLDQRSQSACFSLSRSCGKGPKRNEAVLCSLYTKRWRNRTASSLTLHLPKAREQALRRPHPKQGSFCPPRIALQGGALQAKGSSRDKLRVHSRKRVSSSAQGFLPPLRCPCNPLPRCQAPPLAFLHQGDPQVSGTPLLPLCPCWNGIPFYRNRGPGALRPIKRSKVRLTDGASEARAK